MTYLVEVPAKVTPAEVTPAEKAVAAVVNADGVPVGVGALVGPRQVLTCAHVVNAALGLDPRTQPAPDVTVRIGFPLLDPARSGRTLQANRTIQANQTIRARVTRWLPPPRQSVTGDDIAGLELSEPPPQGACPVRLLLNPPGLGQVFRLFGYPAGRPDGVWAQAVMRGQVGGGRWQLDADPDAAWRAQPGFSGGPVLDVCTGRVAGLLAVTGSARSGDRDGYAIGAQRLRLAWPDVLDPRQRTGRRPRGATPRTPASSGPAPVTVLHVSDPQFGKEHLFGGNGLTPADQTFDTLFTRLHDDLAGLGAEHGLRPDLMVITGDLAEWGLRTEYDEVLKFLTTLTEAVELPRRHVAIVPGNHDVNRMACQAYFNEQESDEREPLPPYWPKWRHFTTAFERFYADVEGVSFAPDEPWTLFEMPDLAVVVAGLNSTMAESHRDVDHHGWLGEHQLRWFAGRLAAYRELEGGCGWPPCTTTSCAGRSWTTRTCATPTTWTAGSAGTKTANLLLHGHTHDGRLHRLPSGVLAVSTGSTAVAEAARPAEVPNQYQLLTITPQQPPATPGTSPWAANAGSATTPSATTARPGRSARTSTWPPCPPRSPRPTPTPTPLPAKTPDAPASATAARSSSTAARSSSARAPRPRAPRGSWPAWPKSPGSASPARP